MPGSAARAARCRGARGALTKRPSLAELRRRLAPALPRGRRKVGEPGRAGPRVWRASSATRGWAGGAGTPARVARDLGWPALPPHLRLPDLRRPELKAVTVPRSSIRRDPEQSRKGSCSVDRGHPGSPEGQKLTGSRRGGAPGCRPAPPGGSELFGVLKVEILEGAWDPCR